MAGAHTGIRIGFATSTSERCYAAVQAEDGSANADTDRMFGADAVMGIIPIAGATDGLLDVSAFGSDVVTFIVDDQFAAGYRVFVLALGGDDITNVKAGTFTMTSSVASQDVTDPGFQPESVLMVCSSATAAALGQSSVISFGAAAGATPANGILAGHSTHGQATMVTRGYCRSGTGTSGDSVVVIDALATP